VSPPAKDERPLAADEEQRERTRRGARHLRSFSLASKADGPPGGVSLRHGCICSLRCIRSEAPLPQRLLSVEPIRIPSGPDRGLGRPSGPEPTAHKLLSGADIVGKRDPSPSSSAQSPRSETKDWTLQFCRKGNVGGNVGGETGLGSTLCSASAGGKTG